MRGAWSGLAVGVLSAAVLVGSGCSERQAPVKPGTETKSGEPAALLENKPATNAKQAIDRGLMYLKTNQEPDGSYAHDIGMTGLVVQAFASSPRKYREADGPFLGKAVQFLLAHQKEDGGIRGEILGAYTTSIAVMALKSLQNPAYQPNIDRAVAYLKKQQSNEANGYDAKTNPAFGGYGYGSSLRPDLSNTQMVLDAFEAAGLKKDDPAYKDVMVFLNRCQNSSETNDQGFAGTDGSGVYSPTESKAGEYTKPDGTKGLRGYGSMTYALLKSMIYASVSKDDARVQSAMGWIKKHYTLDENPELKDAGLYYYYHTFAKALSVYGEDTITDAAGKTHDWRKDLETKLVSMQRADGSWVNTNAEFWENNPVLCTCYSVLALEMTIK